MARTAEEVQADITRLKARMVSGVSLQSAGDMTVRYDNTNDLKILDLLNTELAGIVSPGGAARTRMLMTRVNMRRC